MPTSGEIEEAPGDTWERISLALNKGVRGLPGGSTLPRLLAEKRGYRNKADLPELTIARVLRWADDHHKRTRLWPTSESGPVHGVRGETWSKIDHALNRGSRGLPRGLSIRQLLAEHRGVRNRSFLPVFRVAMIRWATALIRSASLTLVPPYFCTKSSIGGSFYRVHPPKSKPFDEVGEKLAWPA